MIKYAIFGGGSYSFTVHTERGQAQVGLSPRLPKGGQRRSVFNARLIESEVSYG